METQHRDRVVEETTADGMSAVEPASLRQLWEDRLAPVMFWLSIVYLVIAAGLLHRLPRLLNTAAEDSASEAVTLEIVLILCTLEAVSAAFALEALGQLIFRPLDEKLLPALGRFLAVCILPPLRIGLHSRTRPGHVWLPWLGWRNVDRRLVVTLDRFFSLPMIVIAFLVLPLLAVEHQWYHAIRADPILALLVDIATALIWLAFAGELFIMLAASNEKFLFCLRNWLNVLIVLLPFVEVMPALRVLRLARVLRLDTVAQLARVYRLRGLLMRAWRAILLLKVVQKLLCQSPQKRLIKLKALLAAKQEELADLQTEIEQLEAEIARQNRPAPVLDPSARPEGVQP
jgi:voltage-gated potassium channel